MRIRESDLVNAWLWEKHKDSLQWRRVRLGVVPNHKEARMYSVLLRWADAIFIEKGEVNIVEAKLRPKADAIGQLEYYRKLFLVTPEFSDLWSRPINLIFLTPIVDLGLVEFCTEKGIQYEVFDIEAHMIKKNKEMGEQSSPKF